jgi:hypothetical protein
MAAGVAPERFARGDTNDSPPEHAGAPTAPVALFPTCLFARYGYNAGQEAGDMTTRTVDARSRLTLGPKYANRLVIVREHEDGAVEVIPAEAVPAHEVWLYKDPDALWAVRQGIEEARAGRFAKAPNLQADADDDKDAR